MGCTVEGPEQLNHRPHGAEEQHGARQGAYLHAEPHRQQARRTIRQRHENLADQGVLAPRTEPYRAESA